jgi:hypothetical protein
MHLLAHTALQWMIAIQVQVTAHLVPFILSTVTHLFPFPLSQALPQAVEYYGNSVAMSWKLGFSQSRFYHAHRTGRERRLTHLQTSPLSRHAHFPLAFRRKVGRVS